MYNNLRAQIKISSSPAESDVVPVRKGVRQGSVVSPTLYNNSVLPAQAQVATSCVSKGIDVSLMTYSDDLLNLNTSADRLSKNFGVLSRECNKISLSFNVSKSAVLFFNAGYYEKEIPLSDSAVKPCESIACLGLPIGRSLYSTGTLLVRYVEAKIWIAYGSIIGKRHRFVRRLLASLYNAIALPHVLYIAPFWNYLSSAQCT